eukprot:3611229-Prymnesium_polylepis.1
MCTDQQTEQGAFGEHGPAHDDTCAVALTPALVRVGSCDVGVRGRGDGGAGIPGGGPRRQRPWRASHGTRASDSQTPPRRAYNRAHKARARGGAHNDRARFRIPAPGCT